MSSPTEWYRDNYLISTSSKLIQPSAVNAAFGTEALYWTRPIDDGLLKKMLDNSLCFGVYELPSSTSDIAGSKYPTSTLSFLIDNFVGRGNPRQIGLARLITDEVSFAYLTDVYILDEYQGKGLGTWLIKCVDEALSSWPELRRVVLVTSHGKNFYTDKLHVKEFEQGKNGLVILSKKGAGSVLQD
jgi:GNAT superfamily N-acetyltransferase